MSEKRQYQAAARWSLANRLRSFHYAGQGLVFMLKTQHNAWLHAMATVLVLVAGWYWQVARADWCWLIVAMTLVWMAEAFNTAVEYVCDVVSPNYHLAVKHAKDIAAGAVLVCALGATIVGGLVFWPYWCGAPT